MRTVPFRSFLMRPFLFKQSQVATCLTNSKCLQQVFVKNQESQSRFYFPTRNFASMQSCYCNQEINLGSGLKSVARIKIQGLSRTFSNDSSVPDIQKLTFHEVKEKLEDSKTFILDVREPSELIDDGRIPKSKNIPLGELKDAINMSPTSFEQRYGFQQLEPENSDLRIIVHCKAGVRAAKAAGILANNGFKKIAVYDGILDWTANGGTLVK